MKKSIYNDLVNKKSRGKRSFAILLDPDHSFSKGQLQKIIDRAVRSHADYFFVGGSYFIENHLEECISTIKATCEIPVILFPGNASHLNFQADALLFLSLISGRNPEYLIGQHVIAAPAVKASGIEVIPTGYILLDGGRPSTVSYITFTNPIPQDQIGLILATAAAGDLLGLKLIYLEAGSGALTPVSGQVIQKIAGATDKPVIVGGGINTIEKARTAIHAGADLIVVGNKIDEMPDFIGELEKVRNEA
jgi:putative glycerol-1-phosphate prenyltransferase